MTEDNPCFMATLGLIKPPQEGDDQAATVAETEAAINKAGIHIVAKKTIRVTKEDAEKLYEMHRGKPFYDALVNYITSGEVVVYFLSGPYAGRIWRKLIGRIDSSEAGTLRYRFGHGVNFNRFHGSDGTKNANEELALFFPEIVISQLGD